MKWYNEKVGALNSNRTDDKFLLLEGIPECMVTQQVFNVTYVTHRLSRGFARYSTSSYKLNRLGNFERGFHILNHL